MKQETHSEALTRLNLKPGDMVTVTGKAESFQNGWDNSWTPPMDNFIGKQATFIRESEIGKGVKISIEGESNYFYFPAFVLEKVESAPIEPERTDTVVEVTGCNGCVFREDLHSTEWCNHPNHENVDAMIFDTCPLKSGSITIRLKS